MGLENTIIIACDKFRPIFVIIFVNFNIPEHSPMNILDLDELETLSKKILAHSKSEWAELSLESGHSANLRFAANTVTNKEWCQQQYILYDHGSEW